VTPTLNLLVLRCSDIELSRQFYELLGLRFEKHAHGSGPEHYAHEGEHGVLELYPAKPSQGADATGLGFAVANLDESRQKLLAYTPGPITQHEWGRTFVVRDPDSRRVEIKQA
jgi:lactoylglutathione lyase